MKEIKNNDKINNEIENNKKSNNNLDLKKNIVTTDEKLCGYICKLILIF